MSDSFAVRLSNAWYQRRYWLWLLLPLSAVYVLVVFVRRQCFKVGLLWSWRSPVPVIVVGNITAGGTGKTPMVTAVVERLIELGYRPGILSRGYGSRAPHYPFSVSARTSPLHSGDEPLLLARRTGVPVVIDADRVRAAQQLINDHLCNVLVSDDGLQHYRLQRNVEIVVIDAERYLGNGFCLPAGPLRELPGRLKKVDIVVYNGVPQARDGMAEGYLMQLVGDTAINCADESVRPLSDWQGGGDCHAVAGIGNPVRFFGSLRARGLTVIPHAFADHHVFQRGDFSFAGENTVIMTEKDAVKIQTFAQNNWWYVPVSAELPDAFYGRLQACLDQHDRRDKGKP